MGRKDNSDKYAQILDIIEGMKSSIVSKYTTQLMTTGRMPDSAQKELQVLSQITGAVFSGVQSLGEELTEDEENEELVCVHLNGFKYSCAKVSLGGALPLASQDSREEEPAKPSRKSSVERKPAKVEEELTEKPEKVREPLPEPEEDADIEDEEHFTPSEMDESAEFGDEDVDAEEEPVEDEEVETYTAPAPKMAPQPVYDDELVDDDDFGDGGENSEGVDDLMSSSTSSEFDEDGEDEEAEETLAEEPKEDDGDKPSNEMEEARSAVAAARRSRENAFEEEPSKPIGEMVFNLSKLSVTQMGSGKPEEVVVMIAPLKVSRVSIPAVPIVVALFNRGKVVTKTSYEMGDGGKAIVTISINEMYFLCRGAFDENGKFKAVITTTGASSQQGAQLNVISSKNYGNGKASGVGNGHVKVRYDDESGQGTIEVFPFGTEKDNEFIVLVKNPEFCDTYYVSEHGRGGSTVKIQGKDGWLDIVPSWNGDVLEVEVFDS